MGDLEPLILTVCGAILGAVFMVFMTPDPAPREDCRIHVVDRKVATAYVLKPPTVPPAEPVVIREKCEPPPPPQTVVVHEACNPEKVAKTEKAEKPGKISKVEEKTPKAKAGKTRTKPGRRYRTKKVNH